MKWVREILSHYNLAEEFDRQEVLLRWDSSIGASLKPSTRAVRFVHSILWVEVASPTLAHELSFLKERYIDKLNAHFSEPLVQEIRFIPGRFPRTATKKAVSLSPEDRAAAHALFAAITDPQLRKAFERLYLAHRRREEALLASGEMRCSRCGVVFSPPEDLCPGCRFDAIEDPGETD